MHRRRIMLLVVFIVIGFTVVSSRLVWLQAFQWREYSMRAESFHRRVWTDPAPRGSILDRSGWPISFDVPSHQIVYALDGLEPVRWISRRVRREIRRSREGRDFPYDAEHLWDSLQSVRESLRPRFTDDQELPPHLWLSNLHPRAARALAQAVGRRPESFPGIVVDAEDGEIWIEPAQLFAGEIAVRKIERRLGLPPGELFDKVWRAYERVQDPKLPASQRDEIYRVMEHRLLRSAPQDLVEEIVTTPERFPGLRIREVPARQFAGPAGIAPLIGRAGARRAIDEDRWSESQEPIVDRIRFRMIGTFSALKDRSHHSEDLVGHSGLERSEEDRLRGRSGGTLLIVDHRQNQSGEPLEIDPPQSGRDVKLTLDLELCALLDELAEIRDPDGAAMLVADCRSGEILGWSSYPAATPDVFQDQAEWDRIKKLDRGHFFDRPANYAMEPGSTFKVLVALAALEEGVIDPAERILCTGYFDEARRDRLRCGNHALNIDLDLEEALMRSCNVYFYHVGGDRLGLSKTTEWAYRVGFWQPIGCGAASETVGTAPRASAHSVAIGKAFTTTPLAMLRLTCILANRGTDPGLSLISGEPAPAIAPLIASAQTWQHLIDGMTAVVQDPRGTANEAHYGLSAFDCAVKTGTAGIPSEQLPLAMRLGPDGTPRDLNRAWVIGFAPIEEPQLAFVIGLERVIGHGGEECAPIAARILEWFAENRGLDFRREGSR